MITKLQFKFNGILNYFESKIFLSYLLVALISLVLFSYWISPPAFNDPDAFYHAKMSLLISRQGLVKDFSWFQATILKDCFADHHFLYHLFLTPFVSAFNPLAGVKAATILFAVLFILVLFWFLRSQKVKFAFFYILFLLVAGGILNLRLSMVKANSLSLIFLFFGLYFIYKEKFRPLFFLSFFYVWLYGGWILLPLLTLIYFFAKLIKGKFISQNGGQWKIKMDSSRNTGDHWRRPAEECEKENLKSNYIECHRRNSVVRDSFKLILFSFGGTAAGLIFNPYFPKNLFFYWHQIVQVGLINYQKVIGVGAEWYPYHISQFVGNAPFILIFFGLAFVLFFLDFKNQDEKTITLFLASLLFFVFTLKSTRYIEYFIPFAFAFGGLTFTYSLKSGFLPKISQVFLKEFGKRKIFLYLLFLYFFVIFCYISYKDIPGIRKNIARGAPFTRFQKVSSWLAQNTPEHSIIFHDNWDSSPYLFYHNTRNYYLVGLDPTFMYLYDQDLYWRWVNITTGKQSGNLKKTIQEKFHSNFVFVDKDHKLLENNLIKSGDFKLVYQDEEARVYEAR